MNELTTAKKVINCFICGSTKLEYLFDIGNQPMSGIFPLVNEPDPRSAPLALERCVNNINGLECGNVQLSHIANFSEMYGMSYGYNSSLSPFMISHLKSIADNIKKHVEIKANDWVLDIGCNDGTLLREFGNKTKNLVGVDPSAGKFSDIISSKIKLFVEYFPSKACEEFMNGRKFKSISSIAMFYDLPEPKQFIQKVYENLSEDGIWTVELAEMNEFLKNLSFDQICHEHLLYLDNKQVVELANEVGFKLIEITYSEINGGSACYYFSKNKLNEIYPNLKRTNISQLDQLKRRIELNKKSVMDYLSQIINENKIVYGYGASTKGNVLGNYYGLNSKIIPYVSDINPYKYGRKTPGSQIPIISHEEMRLKKPDYLLLFIWHLRNEVLIAERDFVMNGGKIIVPLPRLHMIDANNYEIHLNSNLNDYSFDISNRLLTL